MFLVPLIFIFIECDGVSHFQQICVTIYVYKMGFPCSTISYISLHIWYHLGNSSNILMKICQKKLNHLWFEN